MAKVLVVDDDIDLLLLHSEVLKNDGHVIFTAQTGADGLQTAEETEPDCVLQDIIMNDMDGLDALREFQSRDPDLPVIIFTGYPSVDNAIEALRRGAFDFLTKGCSLEELTTTVRRAVEQRFLRSENQRLLDELQEANTNLERKVSQATAQIRALNEFNRSLLEGIDSGLLAADNNEKILFANKAALRILELPQAEIIGRSLRDFGFQVELATTPKRSTTPHVGAETHTQDLDSVEKQIRQSQRRSIFRQPDGRERRFGYSLSKPGSSSGSGPAYILLFRDLTEIEELRLHMQRLEKLETLNIIIAGVAHEIKNPIAGIKGVASVLIETFEEDDDRKEYVARILGETNRVIDQVNNFFSFARPSKPKRELIDIYECTNSVVRLMEESGRRKRIDLIENNEDGLPQVYVDKDQIKQIVLNLVTNAIQAIEEDGTVTVTNDKAFYKVLGKDCVRVQVHDSGPGIPDEVRNRLFDPFYTTKQSGTGLGLHISQTIVIEHGGRIEATNHPEGGALVEIYLPVPDEQTRQTASESEAS